MIKQILATLIFFTRLPLWRLTEIEKEYYTRVVPLWPLVGWFTGALMAAAYLVGTLFLPHGIAIVLALMARLLVTGALHEDGLADFCDGFGGGNGSQRTLEIMKDSHIGTYGVLGLVMYFLLMYNILDAFPHGSILPALAFIAIDPLCKYFSSTIIYSLSYARKEEEAKNKLVYATVTLKEKAVSLILGLSPTVLFTALTIRWCPGIAPWMVLTSVLAFVLVPFSVTRLLFLFMKRRIGGYTGDCCGATFLITEAATFLTLLALLR